MAKWYSKRYKAKVTADFKKHGFIPPYSQIMRYAMAPYNYTDGLELCNFDGTCDTCLSPKRGTYASIDYGPDYTETNYYICGKCVVKRHRSEHLCTKSRDFMYSNFEQWKRRSALTEGQFICAWCDDTAVGECPCKAAEYWLERDPDYYRRKKASYPKPTETTS